jgi:hypothetical protein
LRDTRNPRPAPISPIGVAVISAVPPAVLSVKVVEMTATPTCGFAWLLIGLVACSQEAPAPTGIAPRDPIHLVVSGTDREMGLQHGKALAKEIREEVGRRLKARFRAVAKDDKEAAFLEQACRAYTAKTKELLPPEVADELTGVAEGSGLPQEDLLLLEVMHDGLRFHLDHPPLLEAAFASPPAAGRLSLDPLHYLVAAWDGPGGAEASAHVLMLERRPLQGSASLVVTWPGGLGALAGVCAWGAVVQCEVPSERAALSLNGVPFDIGVARVLRSADPPDDLVRAIPPRNGNRILTSVYRTGVRDLALLAQAGPTFAGRLAENEWGLVPAGPGGTDPRATAQDERLGAYPQRPDETQRVELAVAGRGSQGGAVLEITPGGTILWHGAVDAAGKDLRPPIRFPFPSPK